MIEIGDRDVVQTQIGEHILTSRDDWKQFSGSSEFYIHYDALYRINDSEKYIDVVLTGSSYTLANDSKNLQPVIVDFSSLVHKVTSVSMRMHGSSSGFVDSAVDVVENSAKIKIRSFWTVFALGENVVSAPTSPLQEKKPEYARVYYDFLA